MFLTRCWADLSMFTVTSISSHFTGGNEIALGHHPCHNMVASLQQFLEVCDTQYQSSTASCHVLTTIQCPQHYHELLLFLTIGNTSFRINRITMEKGGGAKQVTDPPTEVSSYMATPYHRCIWGLNQVLDRGSFSGFHSALIMRIPVLWVLPSAMISKFSQGLTEPKQM